MKRVIGSLLIASATFLIINNQESNQKNKEIVFVSIQNDSTELIIPKKETNYI